jgi:hypothetical protein
MEASSMMASTTSMGPKCGFVKRSYSSPHLIEYGSVSRLTQTGSGSMQDSSSCMSQNSSGVFMCLADPGNTLSPRKRR